LDQPLTDRTNHGILAELASGEPYAEHPTEDAGHVYVERDGPLTERETGCRSR